ncbi:MAG: hypothetical protein WA294_15050 [Acidobacteriaceae bacterium]
MKRFRRTELRIERREISIFLPSHPGQTPPGTDRCPVCGGVCFPTRLDEIGGALGIAAAGIRQALDEGRFHGSVGADGQLLLCADSLLPGPEH